MVTSSRARASVRRAALAAALTSGLIALLGGLLAAPAQATTEEVSYPTTAEGYAPYQPQTKCIRTPRSGILLMADWLTARGGGFGPISRSCTTGGITEHKESRAFDWMLDATDPADVALADEILAELFATDAEGQTHAVARRMGVMYVIWNDRVWASYRNFEPRAYLNSGCRNRRTCSTTLRHRDHMHISLVRKGANGRMSWYLAQHSD